MKRLVGVLAIAVAGVMGNVREADACGGCFAPPTEVTVVTDHRMALSVSMNQTILWDQIRYSGDPSEFAWVLPVRPNARVEVANDEFFQALDATTQPRVTGPSSPGGGFGCALTGCSADSTSASESAGGETPVQVLNQSVVGPYETVTLRSTDDDALTKWLRDHQFAIPPSIEPTIRAYVTEKFDFIALRLRPQCSERSMQPVRVVSPGADPTLPLRMVAAGVGAKVGITLYVISEGRWEPQNFPFTLIKDAELRWNRFENKSTYEEYSQKKMAEANGRTWIVEAARKQSIPSRIAPQLGYPYAYPYNSLPEIYFRKCAGTYPPSASSSSSSSSSSSGSVPTPCPKDVRQPPPDSGVASDRDAASSNADAAASGAGSDAGSDAWSDAGIGDGETHGDAGGPPPSSSPEPKPIGAGSLRPDERCLLYDDLDVALEGLHKTDVWITRLRATLPVDALQGSDLRLQAATDQTEVSNIHYASTYTDEDAPTNGRSGCGSAPKERRAYGSWVLGVLTALGIVSIVRRRRHTQS